MSVLRALRRWARRVGARGLGGMLLLAARRASEAPIRRILVIRVDERVGNVLLTTPVLRALREGLPDATVDVLVARSKASILEGVIPTLAFEKKDALRRPWRFVGRLMGLRRARYDVAIDASHWHAFSLTSAALLAWTGAPMRILHDRGAARRFGTHWVPAPTAPEYEVTTKLRLLAPLGLAPEPGRLETGLGRGAAADRMGAWLAGSSPGDRRIIGLAPGARKLDHRAPESLFIELGRHAEASGARALVLWGPGEEQLAARIAEGCGALIAPATTLDELAALMRRCRIVVANDTGPMHLAVACEAPTLALFRSADPTRWGHVALGHTVVEVDDEHPERTRLEALEAFRRLLAAAESSP